MRAVLSFIIGLLVVAFVVCLVIFGVQNQVSHAFTFLGAAFTWPVWLPAVLAAVAGFILGLLVVTPARVAADAGQRALRTNTRRQERDLAEMRTANEQLQSQLTSLQAEHGNVVRERDAYRTTVETLRAPAASAQPEAQLQPRDEPVAQTQPQEESAAQQTVTYAAPADGAGDGVGDGAVAERPVTTETVAPDGAAPDRVATATPVASGAATQTAEESPPTFGDRLRTLFAKPGGDRSDLPPEGPTATA